METAALIIRIALMLISILLVVVVLLQKTKSSGLGASFGGDTQSFTTKGKAAWRYGRIEVRASLPQGQGTWPAIWMLPEADTYGRWAASGEIARAEARIRSRRPGAACFVHPLTTAGVSPERITAEGAPALRESSAASAVFARSKRGGEPARIEADASST